MSFLWRILPQPFPAPIFVQDYEITKSKGCGTYCAVCCWGYLVAWTLILCVLGLLGAWMWFLMEINYTMPHTFAWESLLRPFGSVPYMTECSSNVTGPAVKDVAANSLANDCWTSSYTVPCVPIIASMILIMTVINGIWCLLPVPLLNLYSAVLNMRANLAWHLFFFLIAFPVVSVYFVLDLTGLRDRMDKTIEIEGDNYTISPSWAKTQADAHCCGVISYEDWKSTTGLYPPSCCNTTTLDGTDNGGAVCSSGSPVPASSVWTDGCFNLEYNRVLLYGGLELVLIWCTYCISLALYKLIVSLSLRQYEVARAGGDVSAKAAPTATHSQPQSYQQSQSQSQAQQGGGPIPIAADAKTPLLSQQH